MYYSLKKKIGLIRIKKNFDQNKIPIFLFGEWMSEKSLFFISDRFSIEVPKVQDAKLETTVHCIFKGTYPYFQVSEFNMNVENKWHYNPITKFAYSKSQHWTDIPDFSEKNGDIKFVWELSRFCYLFDIIRYDHHFSQDSAEFVFSEIENWIDSNPPEFGPNYMSGQEIALRLLNWIFALHYYSDSPLLRTAFFNKLTNSLYLQTKHIASELYFSNNFVRNNHLLSESLALFTVGLMFPHFKESKEWTKNGYQIYCREIMYQFDMDGAYLQHSFNYQRVAIQLSTWFVALCNINKINITEDAKKRLLNAIEFMTSFIGNEKTGALPNFGNNDGSLFFPLNNKDFFNFYPQLEALANTLHHSLSESRYEDSFWFGLKAEDNTKIKWKRGVFEYKNEGYYITKEDNYLTFLWCPKLNHRPAQADMLHLDIWCEGENILRDGGTYLYNTKSEFRNFFFGSRSHNTILFDGNDLMKKGRRFIFYFWPKKLGAFVQDEQDNYIFSGAIRIFPKDSPPVDIIRKVIKKKNMPIWTITDTLINSAKKQWTQVWNISDNFLNKYHIIAMDNDKVNINQNITDSYTSSDYAEIRPAKQVIFSTTSNSLTTTITKK